MKDDHEPGHCYACGKHTQVRWKNLYTIGSEGTWLCMPCELKVVNFINDMSRDAMRANIRKIKARRRKEIARGLIDMSK